MAYNKKLSSETKKLEIKIIKTLEELKKSINSEQ